MVKKMPERSLSLKVFQASPLAYGKIAIPFMDLDAEEDILREALEESNIDVTFEIATASGLGAFLAQGNSFLHLSCHGHPDKLFVEDGYGGCHILVVGESLKEWIQAGGSELKFVFVSACHSRSVGDAFKAAGVPYVVCCEQDGHQLLDQAARIFARDFYTAVANRATLEQAFELAKNGVIQPAELKRVSGIDPQEEAKKFVLLTADADKFPQQQKIEDNGILSDSNHNRAIKDPETEIPQGKALAGEIPLRSISSESVTASMLPVPPQPFLERELDMYDILTALFIRRTRLVVVSGDKGIGKVSLAKALAQYMDKRSMWGKILWLPPLQNGKNVSVESMFKSMSQSIPEEFYEKKAVLMIDAKCFSDNGMTSLCEFLDDIFERTKYLKVIVIRHTDSGDVKSIKNEAGFPFLEARINLGPLSYRATAELFCRFFGKPNWMSPMNRLLKKKSDPNVWKILGEGNPFRTLLTAKNISDEEFKKLTELGLNPIHMEDFTKSLNYVTERMSVDLKCRSSGRGAPVEKLDLRSVVIHNKSTAPAPPSLRTQEEVIERFMNMLIMEKKVFRKNVPSFIKKAKKNQKITTTINGVPATECVVEDDTSWIVMGQVANELYPLTDEKFKLIYDYEHPMPIPAGIPQHDFLVEAGYMEYRSKRKVFAHKVDESDMIWFRNNDNDLSAATTKEAYFMAPWGTPCRVEYGDYLVMKYPDGNDDIYRIQNDLFRCSYVDDSKRDSIHEKNNDLLAHTAALEERIKQYGEANPGFKDLEDDIRRHFQALLGAMDLQIEAEKREE